MLFLKNIFGIVLMMALVAPIELEKKSILDNKVELLMPKGWKPMSQDLIKIKYPGVRPPKLVYSDVSGSISIAFNHTDSKASPSMLEKYKEVLKTSLETAYPDAVWEEDGIKEINGKKAGVFRVITEARDDKIYNYMVFTDMDGKLLICSFNCLEKKLKAWKPLAEEIMNSISIK
ncbi:MAG: hypothetical protein ACKVOW_00160 [Chitinophagaceae bacterium]